MTASNTIARSHIARRRVPIALALAGLALVAGVGVKLWMDNAKPTAKNDVENAETPGDEKDPAKDDGPQTVRLSPEVARKYGIRIGTAKKRKLAANIVAPGRVAFNTEATAVVGTPIQGRVVEIKTRAGDVVQRGAELLVIESASLGEAQSDYLQKRAVAAAAKSSIEPARGIYARAKQLYEEDQIIGLTELQKREVELRQAEGALGTAEAAQTAAENKLHLLGMDGAAVDDLVKSGTINPRFSVKSPLSGEVVERNVNLGELVTPEREKLFVVADTSTRWIWADVPEGRAHEVAIGSNVCINLTSAGDCTSNGVVSHIAPSIDDQTRSLRVRIEVKNQPALRPGMFAQVEIKGKAAGENAEPVIVVPEAAIQSVNGSTAVFIPIKNEPNAFQVRKVGTGNYVDGFAGIITGLDEGEQVVTAGSAILKADLLKASAKDDD